jgi:hypothetical protein
MSIPHVHPSELDDFEQELRREGRSIEEFDVSATPQRLADQSGGISAYSGTVTVRNRTTGTERTYRTGHGSRWLAEFADDLKVGLLDADKIFADPSLPATLRYAGKSVNCHTLQEAVLAWMRLEGDDRDEATIRADDGTIYTSRQIEHLHIQAKRP